MSRQNVYVWLAERATITVDEAAEVLGVERKTAYSAVRDGHLPSIKLGRRLLIPTAGLLSLLGVSDPKKVPVVASTPKPARTDQGRALQEAREAASLTRAQVARLTSRTPLTVRRWEHGETTPPKSVLPDLAVLYGVPVERLLTE